MTISTTTLKNSYSGDGSTTTFAYGFKIFASTELKVYIRSSTGAETLKTEGTGSANYAVTNVGVASGGNVVFVTAPASGETVVIVRDTPLTQGTDYQPADPFPAADHEDALDKLTHIVQEQQEELDRSFKVSKTTTITTPEFTDSPSDRASKIVGFSSDGNSLTTYANPDVDTELTAIGGLTSAANKMIRYTGSGTADLIDFLDQDDMSGDSASAVASQQSVKAYVDSGTATLTNKTLTAPKFADGGFIADANGNELIKLETTASAVNELSVTNAASGNGSSLSATGDDTNIDIDLTPKGSGEVNIAAGNLNYGGTAVTSTGAELNILDGVTATASELNILDGVTATATELNLIDGVTATTAELNIVDGDTTATSTTVADADRVVYNDDGTMKQVAVTDLATYFGSATVDQTVKTSDGGIINLQTSDTTVTDGSVLGSIDFKAPDEASGTDAILLGASIAAVAEGTFAADNNATELVFKTGASEAATQKMVLTSAGNLGLGTTGPTAFGGTTAQVHHASTYSALLVSSNDHILQLIASDTHGAQSIGTRSNHDLNFTANDSVKMTVKTDGDVSMGGSLIFSGSGEGVYLGVTSATAANLLDDYEEGTWTAALEGSTSDPSSAVTVSSNYTKIGRLVYITSAFANVNTTGAAGGIRITGLPYTPSPANQMTGNCTFHTMATITSNTVNICPFFQASDVAFYQTAETAGAWSEVSHNAGTGRYLYFTGLYQT